MECDPRIFIVKVKHIETTNCFNNRSLSSYIKSVAFGCGFDEVGICTLSEMTEDTKFLRTWLDKGMNAEMRFLEKNIDIRNKPNLLFPEAKSIIVFLVNYYSEDKFKQNKYTVSKYAYGADYHSIIKSKLNNMLNILKENMPELSAKCFVDTAPIFERSMAVKAGLGFIGKNKCLINRKLGSFCFIGVMITNLELQPDVIKMISCEDCSLCIDSCPTGALSDYGLDARKCISYHTVENKSKIPNSVAIKMTNQIFGCDICQDVCPHNRNLTKHMHEEFEILSQIENISDISIDDTDSKFKTDYTKTSLMRAGREKILDNMKIINNNQ